MKRCLIVVVFVALSLACASLTHGDDWPQFRGPTGQGLVPSGSLPSKWGPERNVVWKQPIPGKGWSSPIIVKGRIYLTTAVPQGGSKNEDQSLRVLALDAATGKILWDREVFKQTGAQVPPIHEKNSHASPTAISDGERLYVHFGHQGTACLRLDGQIVWRNDRLKYAPVHGNGGSPILVDKALVFNVDGSDQQYVVALDRATGQVLWKADRKSQATKRFAFCTPLLIEVEGKPQIISPAADVVTAHDPQTGREVWRVRYEGYSVVPRPVYGQGLVFLSTGYDSPQLLAIRPTGTGDVTDTHVAWKARHGAPLNPSPLLVGEELYLVSDNGIASCLDAATGKVHWRQRLDGNFSASPIHAGGLIYFTDEEGTTHVVKAGRQFKTVAKNAMEERTLASLAAADGVLFLRTEKHLYRIEAK